MKRTLYLLSMWVLLLLTGCNDPKHVTDTLTLAEALMNEYPDSAWAMLNTLSPDDMGQHRTRALYALLYTQAQDKNYIDETNDSLISLAVDYYRNTDDVRHKFLSYYYKGRVHFNAEDYLNATLCYMEAEQLADEVEDDYLKGLLYAELGRIYRLYYDYPKSLEAHQKAAEYYERAGKVQHRNYMWYNQSDIYRNMDKYADSEHLLRKVLTCGKEMKDSVLIRNSIGNLVMLCIEQQRISEAKELNRELKSFANKGWASSSLMAKLAKMYLAERDFQKAEECIETGWNRTVNRIDSANLYFSSAELLYGLGKEKDAYQELLKGISLQTEEAHLALQHPILTVQRDYLSEKLDFEAYKLRMRKLLNIVSVLFFLLLLAVVIYVSVRIFKKYKAESQQKISCLMSEKEKAEKKSDKIASAWKQLDRDKKKADQTIATLKEDISRKEKESNAKISDLVQKLGKGESIIGVLKDKLARKEKESDAEISDLKQQLREKEEDNHRNMASLSEAMEAEKVAAHKTVQELNDLLAQKEEARLGMEALVQKLENESKRDSELVTYLRKELKGQESEYRQNFDRLVEMFRTSIVTMGEIMLDFEEIKAPNTFVDNAIKQWKKKYFVGSKALKNLERLVNEFHGDAMCHFRKEVRLHNKEDYQLVCYLFAGVSIKVIAWLTSKSEAGVYQWRIRLRDKIELSDLEHKDLYLELLFK